MEIRAEAPEDVEAINQVNTAAFGRTNEADLINRLRENTSVLSFVAIVDRRVVGHILFSPVSINPPCESSQVLGLAPIAVLPNLQNQGIGSRLVRHGLKECSRLGFGAVVVLGHPQFYSRFGFMTAKAKNLVCEYSVPDEAFMVVELQPGALQNCSGTARYRPEFASV